MKAKKLVKLIRNGTFGAGLKPDQEVGAKCSFLANLLVGTNIPFDPDEVMKALSRKAKMDRMLELVRNSEREFSDDDIKKALCSMITPWARGVISVCLGYSVKELTSVGLPPGYIAPLIAQTPYTPKE